MDLCVFRFEFFHCFARLIFALLFYYYFFFCDALAVECSEIEEIGVQVMIVFTNSKDLIS